VDALESDGLPGIGRHLLPPQELAHLETFIEPASAQLERHADGVVFVGLPADADSEI
jgi:hypothetical protein